MGAGGGEIGAGGGGDFAGGGGDTLDTVGGGGFFGAVGLVGTVAGFVGAFVGGLVGGLWGLVGVLCGVGVGVVLHTRRRPPSATTVRKEASRMSAQNMVRKQCMMGITRTQRGQDDQGHGRGRLTRG
jgi:hypothetical protein